LTPGLRRGAGVSAASAVLLLVLMFGTAWFGVVALPGRSSTRSGIVRTENAWQAMTLVRWVMLLAILVTLGSVVLHLSQRSHGAATETGAVVTSLGSATAVLLAYRVLISLPTPDRVVDQKLGAVLGLVCAVGIAIGGYESLREERRLAENVVQRSRAGVASGRPAR
jgi:hypothetical protein